jgi:hypothetical protein
VRLDRFEGSEILLRRPVEKVHFFRLSQ